MSNVTSTLEQPYCDCGAPATGNDSTGWFCDGCKEYVQTIHNLINLCIQSQRGITQPTEAEREQYKRNYHRDYMANRRKQLQQPKAA